MSATVIIGRFAERRTAVQLWHRRAQLASIGLNVIFVCVVLLVYLAIGACLGWWLCRHFGSYS
jgi:hypothetical protein